MARLKPPRPAPVRTMGLDSMDDLQAFNVAVHKRRTPEHIRIALRLPELNEDQRHHHERRINRLLHRSTWVESTFCATLLLGLTLAFPLSPAGSHTARAIAAWWAQGLLSILLGVLAGRLIGRPLREWRLQAACQHATRQAAAQHAAR